MCYVIVPRFSGIQLRARLKDGFLTVMCTIFLSVMFSLICIVSDETCSECHTDVTSTRHKTKNIFRFQAATAFLIATHKSLSYFMMLYDEFAAVKMIGFVDFNHFFSKHVNFDKEHCQLVMRSHLWGFLTSIATLKNSAQISRNQMWIMEIVYTDTRTRKDVNSWNCVRTPLKWSWLALLIFKKLIFYAVCVS